MSKSEVFCTSQMQDIFPIPYLPQNHLNNFNNYSITWTNFPNFTQNMTQYPHNQNIFCFHNCSIWNLSLNSQLNKKSHPQYPVTGRILNQPHPINVLVQSLPQNIFDYLPIDLVSNQRFVLDPFQPKENLFLQFDFSKVMNQFSVINKNYSSVTFEFIISGQLHGVNLLKSPINFKVKGYDILKSIQLKLSSINQVKKYNTEHIESHSLNAVVFQNMQCSFGIEFTVSNLNIAKFISSSNRYMDFNFSLCDIKIVKLNILYCLPLCVFSNRNLKRLPAYFNQQQILQFQKMMLQSNLIGYSPSTMNQHFQIKESNQNFCNWYSFMTSTTPFLFEKETLNVYYDILSSFKYTSLFGAHCLFQTSQSKLSRITYFPKISTITIYYQDNNRNSTNSLSQSSMQNGKVAQQQKEPLSLNGSFQTNVSESAILNLSNMSNGNYKTICYKDKGSERHLKGQLRELLYNETEIASLTLEDISKDSWFSLIWYPQMNNQESNSNSRNVNQMNFPIFKVFYQFHQGCFNGNGKFITVIGVMQKAVKLKEPFKKFPIGSEESDSFWFRDNNDYESDENYEYNRNLFYSLFDQAKLIEL